MELEYRVSAEFRVCVRRGGEGRERVLGYYNCELEFELGVDNLVFHQCLEFVLDLERVLVERVLVVE